MMTTIQYPKLGQSCIVKGRVSKRRESVYTKSGLYEGSQTQFVRWNIPARKALFVGWRTWSVGKSFAHYSYEDYGGGIESREIEYKASEYRVVWMFIASERERPFYAFPEDVTLDLCGAIAI